MSTAAKQCPHCGRPGPFRAAVERQQDQRFAPDEQPLSVFPSRAPSDTSLGDSPAARKIARDRAHEAQRKEQNSQALPLLIAISIVVAAAAWYALPSKKPPTAKAAPAPARVWPETQIRLAEEAVRGRMKDPESARFTDVRMGRITDPATGVGAVCGNVNAKNGFGGYTGPTRFIAANAVAFMESDTKPGEFAKVWADFCTR